MKLLPTCLTAMVLIAANMIQPAHAALRRRSGGRKLLESAPDASIIPGRYIVVFDGTVPSVKDKASRLLLSKTASIDAAQVLYEYDNAAIQGVSVQNVSPEHLRQLEADPQVLYIEPDVTLGYARSFLRNETKIGSFLKDVTKVGSFIKDVTKIGSYERDANKIGSFDRNATKIDSFVNDETKMQTQTNVRSVGLDRLDQDALPLDGRYRYKHTGKGVTVFVMDSGMRLTHQEFQGRATCGLDAVLGQESVIHCEDMFGHGTHVAGIVGGKTVGVAKNVHLVAVKVGGLAPLFPSGSSMLAGLDYILKHKKANPSQPMIVVISIEGSKFQAIDEATVALISSGVTVVVGAGNNGDDACNYSPAGANGAIAVGVSDRSDSVPDWSNYGSCVSMYAPGDAILSAWRRNDTDLDEATGSSQSAPFVAGAAALYLEKDPSMNPKEILHELLKDSLKNILTGGLITNSTELVNITSNRLVHIERL